MLLNNLAFTLTLSFICASSIRRLERQKISGPVIFEDTTPRLDGPCVTSSKSLGTCKRIQDCKSLWLKLGSGNIVHCFFNGDLPVVCCPLDNIPETIPRKLLGCGKREGLMRGRTDAVSGPVVDGVEAIPNSWPWMAAIFESGRSGLPQFVCGASLISKNYILSAAHCFSSETNSSIRNTSKYFVVLGAHDLSSLGVGIRIQRRQQPIAQGERYGVSSIKLHPKYNAKMYYHDLAVLKLSTEAIYSGQIGPVCLPKEPLFKARSLTNMSAYVTGWGDTSYGGQSNSKLREVSLPITSRKFCIQMYSGLATRAFPQGVTRGQICAGGTPNGGKDACQGDSGGPLVVELETGVYSQVGIVSFGYNCAEPNIPGVYTNVSHYFKWIEKHSDITRRIYI